MMFAAPQWPAHHVAPRRTCWVGVRVQDDLGIGCIQVQAVRPNLWQDARGQGGPPAWSAGPTPR